MRRLKLTTSKYMSRTKAARQFHGKVSFSTYLAGVKFSHTELRMKCVNDTIDECSQYNSTNTTISGRVGTTSYSDCYQWFCFQDYCNTPNSTNIHLITLHGFVLMIILFYIITDTYYSLTGSDMIFIPLF
jgi:hypothetical protein